MKKVLSASLLAMVLATGAHAQTSPAASPGAAPSAPAAPVAMDPASEAKFKAADPKGSGFIEGAALKPYEPAMKDIDTDKDGKISRAEYAAAVKAGIIN